MAQTFRDFVTECELYPYSKENFELMKECSELRLMERFMENVAFMEEYHDELAESNITFSESYFIEEVDPNAQVAVRSDMEKKKESILTRVVNGMKKLLKRFVNFMRGFIVRLLGTAKVAKECLETLREIPLTAEDVESINKIVGDIKETDEAAGVKKQFNQPFVSRLGLKYSTPNPFAGKKAEKRAFENRLALVLADDTVIVGPGTGAVDAESLIDVLTSDNTREMIGEAVDALRKAAAKNGITIKVDDKTNKKLVDKLQDIEPKMQKLAVYYDKKLDIETVDDVYSRVVGIVGNTISTYTDYLNTRKQSLTALRTWVNAKKKAAKADQKAREKAAKGVKTAEVVPA